MAIVPRSSLTKLLPAAWSGAALIFLALLVVQPTTAVYLLIAGLPTLAMLMMDDDPEQRGVFAVGALNLAGALPFVLLSVVGNMRFTPLWTLNAYMWPFLGALLGATLYYGVPMLVRYLAKVEEERENRRLGERQQALVEEWGANVASVQLDFSNKDGIR
ncbi:MAG: hypothetical protein C6Y20_02385 [Tagaea sp. CACIAM 22H2]|nr:hypothetical protein [Tagaea sp. CACIAM 22H2]